MKSTNCIVALLYTLGLHALLVYFQQTSGAIFRMRFQALLFSAALVAMNWISLCNVGMLQNQRVRICNLIFAIVYTLLLE